MSGIGTNTIARGQGGLNGSRVIQDGPLDVNLDDYVGYTYRGLPILPLTGDQSVLDQLVSGDSIDPGRDGVITFSFYNAQHANGWLAAGHYPGSIRDADGNFIPLVGGTGMTPFTAEQEAAARAAIELWDDLVAVEFREVNGHGNGTADIVLANSADPGQAFAYYGGSSQGGWDGFLGDVFVADPRLNPSNGEFDFGQYGRTTLIHELGHALGLSHPGQYNFGQDSDGDGEPDPLTYDEFAEYAQDSHQYTIMSYWGGWSTGGGPTDWHYSGGYLYDGSPQGPMLHDIAAIQSIYGADPTTRAGATTYGFNSNAENPLYDFNENPLPYYALYDAGGEDTIDLSGFQSSQYLNLNPGVFSSIGDVTLTDEEVGQLFRDAALLYSDVDYFEFGYTSSTLGRAVIESNQAYNAALLENDTGVAGLGTVNYETFAIAYNTTIENAVGGQGRDLIVGNDVANRIDGQAGDDVLDGGLGNDTLVGGLGNDTLIGGDGEDLFMFANDGSVDAIADFQTGVDLIDLRSVEGATSDYVTYDAAAGQLQIDTDHNGSFDMLINVNGSVATSDILFV